jgi:hypothetical protein
MSNVVANIFPTSICLLGVEKRFDQLANRDRQRQRVALHLTGNACPVTRVVVAVVRLVGAHGALVPVGI